MVHSSQNTESSQQETPEDGSPFVLSAESLVTHALAHSRYLAEKGKTGSRKINIREALDTRNGIQLDLKNPYHLLVSQLMDLPVVQRMKHVAQLGTAHFVYKDGTHSRFGHSVGSAYLACSVLDTLASNANHKIAHEIEHYAPAVIAATMLHDIGHIAPRSHLAELIFFPNEKGTHENITLRIIREDPGLRHVLRTAVDRYPELLDDVIKILEHSPDVPRWTWLLVSGGGWNFDRADWVFRDSVHCGVNYGEYDLVPLTKRLHVTEDGDLAVDSEGVSLIQNFFQARYNMYQFVYFHPVSRVAQKMYLKLAQRAREVLAEDGDIYADEVMIAMLTAESSDSLPLSTLLAMTESRWQYHVERWMESSDPILSDYATRLTVRNAFKHFPDDEYHRTLLGKLLDQAGLPREYYLLEVPAIPGKSKKDLGENALKVRTGKMQDGSPKLRKLADENSLLNAYAEADLAGNKNLIAIPVEPFIHATVSEH